MRKVLVVLICMMALFAVVSCKNEPSGSGGSGSDDTSEPDWDAGSLVIKPAEGCSWSDNNKDRFQFFINHELKADDVVEFLVMLSDSFEKIVPRSSNADSSWRKFDQLSVDELELNGEWYEVSFKATEDCEYIGITCMLKSGAEQSEDLYFGITDLIINEEAIDFDTLGEGYATPFIGAANPSAITAVITE